MRKGFVYAVLPLLMMNACIVLVDIPLAGAQPPANGTWSITAAESLTGGSYDINNGNLIIRDGGSLTLDGATIVINDTNGPQYSVEVQRGGTLILTNGATIVSNSVNNYYYFYIRLGATVSIRDSFVYDAGDQWGNQQNAGIYIASSSTSFDRSTVSRGGCGIIVDECSPVIANSTITNNSGSGVIVDAGAPWIHTNNISANGFGGPWWTGWHGINLLSSNATVSGNVVSNNGWNGNNYGSGIYASGGNVTIDNNTVSSNAETGIVADNHCIGTISDNNVELNSDGGIFVFDHSDLTISKNRVTTVNNQAFLATDLSAPYVVGNTFNSTNYRTVGINAFSSPVLEGNKILALAGGSALEIYDNCRPVLRDNIISSANGLGLDIWHWVDAVIENNDINSSQSAVAFNDFSKGSVTGNTLVSRNNQGILVNQYSEVTGSGNTINSRQEGLEVTGVSRLTMTNSSVNSRNDNALELYGQSVVYLEQMTVVAQTSTGIYAAEALVDIINSSIFAPGANDIHLGGSAWNHPCLVRAVNTTFNQSDSAFDDDNSVLNVSWYVHNLWVEWQNEVRVPLAEVSIKNVQGENVQTAVADFSGELHWLIVQEYTQNRSRRVDYTRHNFSAQRNGVNGYFGANVNGDLDIRIIMQDILNDPSIHIDYPVMGGLYNSSVITVRGTADDPESDIYRVDVWPALLPAVTATGTEDWWANITLADGNWTVTVNATNFAGVKEATTVSFAIDTLAPALSVTRPRAVDIVNTTEITVSGTTEPGAVVTVNGVNTPVGNAGDFTLNITLTEGLNNLTVASHDKAMNFNITILAVTLDTVPPALNVTNPPGEIVVVQTPFIAAGEIEPGAVISVGGKTGFNAGGFFFAPVDLAEGPNAIEFVASDIAGNTARITRTIILDSVPPVVSVVHPPEEFLTNISSLTVTGTADDRALTTLTVNGQTFTGPNAANFSATVTLTEGKNYVVVEGRDRAGHITNVKRTVTLDTTPPPLVVFSPLHDSLTNTPRKPVTGSTEFGAAVTVGAANTTVDARGYFNYEYQLSEGSNTIVVKATDRAGNAASVNVMVTLDTRAPALKVTAPSKTSSGEYSVEVSGTAEPGAVVMINGRVVRNNNGHFTATVALNNGQNRLTITATDAAGNVATKEMTVAREGLSGMETGLLATGIILLVVGLAVGYLAFHKKGGGTRPASGPELPSGPAPGKPASPPPEPDVPAAYERPVEKEKPGMKEPEKAPEPPKEKEPEKPGAKNPSDESIPEPQKAAKVAGVVSMAHEGEAHAGEHEAPRKAIKPSASKAPEPAPKAPDPKKPDGKTADNEVGAHPGKEEDDISNIMARLK